MVHAASVMVMLSAKWSSTSEQGRAQWDTEMRTVVTGHRHRGESPDKSRVAQIFDLVADRATSPQVPLQVLLDLDLQTRVSSSDVEDDSPSGSSSSTISAAAFLAAATTLGLSILM